MSPHNAPTEGRLLTPAETAAYLQTTPQTLAVWRCTKRHKLPYVKVGALVRYRLEDLHQWVAARAR